MPLSQTKTDQIIIALTCTSVLFFGLTVCFLVLWQITIDDRNATRELYNACEKIQGEAGLDNNDGG